MLVKNYTPGCYTVMIWHLFKSSLGGRMVHMKGNLSCKKNQNEKLKNLKRNYENSIAWFRIFLNEL